MELAEYQERIATSDLREGDFLYVIEPAKMSGPRGGRYRFDGLRVESRVLEAGYLVDARGGFAIRTRAYARGFVMPGNSQYHTTCIIKKRES